MDQLKTMQGDIGELKTGQDELHTDTRRTRVLVEKQEHNIGLMAEQYGDIALKLARVREIDELRDRVKTLETVVSNHSAKINKLQKAE